MLTKYGGIWITSDVTPKKFINSQNEALKDFNNMVNDILYNSDTKMIHSEVAEEIRKCSSVNDLISFSKDITLTDEAQELKIAKGIDKFAEGILEKSYDMIRNL